VKMPIPEWALILLFVAAYILVMRYLLPKLGVST